MLFLLVVFIAVNASVLALRNYDPGHGHFRTPTAVPVLALLTCFGLLTQQVRQVWAFGGTLLLGGLVYGRVRLTAGRATT